MHFPISSSFCISCFLARHLFFSPTLLYILNTCKKQFAPPVYHAHFMLICLSSANASFADFASQVRQEGKKTEYIFFGTDVSEYTQLTEVLSLSLSLSHCLSKCLQRNESEGTHKRRKGNLCRHTEQEKRQAKDMKQDEGGNYDHSCAFYSHHADALFPSPSIPSSLTGLNFCLPLSLSGIP